MAKGSAKARIQRAARLVLGHGNLASLCDRAAAHFGETWDGKKGSGYLLLRRILAIEPNALRPVKKARATSVAPAVDANAEDFLASYAWRSLRMRILVKLGARCGCCGATPKDGVRMHVDHIKPRRLFPELALDETNLQVLCEVCNHGKGNWDQTDWREKPTFEPPASHEPVWSRRIN